jgi:hypothetical protein
MPTMNPSQAVPYTGKESLQFIPSLCVSERYDSNVFYAPKTPGVNPADFVTDVNPQVRVNHNSEYVAGYMDLGGFYESYVRNSELNFFGTADTLYLNLDNSVKRLLPNASLSITDYVRYTPTPPGFANIVAGTTPGAPVNIQNVYAQGFLAYRTNNVMNNSNIVGSYTITPLTSLNASYSYNILRFGSSPAPSATTPLLLFDTTSQTGTVGAKTQLTPLDSFNVTYSHTQTEFTPSSSPSQSSLFKINTAVLGWTRNLTPYMTTQIGGGLLIIDPGLTTYALNAALTLNTPNNVATLSYARSAFPSYAGVGVPVTSDAFSLTAIQKFTAHWELNELASYTHASGGSGSTAISYNTYVAAVDLYYWVTRIWSIALSLDYMNFHTEFAGATNNFDRYAATISVKATWN